MGEGMTLEKLQVIIEAQTKPYRDEVEKLKKQTTSAASHVERQTAKMKKSFGGLGKVVASVLGVGAIVAFAKSCIDLGSDLAEVQNVVDVTFGKMSGAVDAFSKNAITQFGLSELTAKKYMSTYGAMAKSFGIVEEAGYQMSASITGLTGDVASFYNLSTDEAYTKLKSIFTGETESLKELGVVMTQTALDQYALNNGFGKTTAKMTEQEKVMLRYQFVMSGLSDASGDFARTSQSWANQVRVLSLQFESLKATIGQGLINAFTPVIRVINTILAKLQTLAAYFKAFTVVLFGDAGGSSDIADSMDSAAGSSGAVADNMNSAANAAKKMKEYTLGIDELNVLNPDEGSGGSGGGAGGGGSLDFGDMSGELFGEVTVNPEIEKAVERLRKAIDAIKELAKPTTDALKRLWNEGLSLLGKFTWTALEDFWNYFLVPLGSWALGEGFPRFIDITNDFLKTINWEAINEALKNFWQALEPFAEKVGEGLLDFYEDLSKVGAAFINTVVPGGLNALADALNKIDSDQAKAIGYGLGVIATSILTFKITKSILDFFDKLKGVILAAGGASTFGITLTLSLVAATGVSWATALDLLDRYENGTDEEKKEIEMGWDKNKQDSIDKNKWGMGNRYGQMEESANAYKNDNAYKKQFDYLKSIPRKVKQWFNQNLKDTEDWLDALNEQREKESKDFQAWIEDKKISAKQNWEKIQTWWNSTIASWWNNSVAPWFTAEKWRNLYKSIKTSLESIWDETVGAWLTQVRMWWDNNVAPWFTVEKWSGLYESVKTSLKTKWDETAGTWGTDLQNWWNIQVAPWFTAEKWSQLYNNIKDQLKTKWDSTVGEWSTNIALWWNTHVSPWFTTEKWSQLYTDIKVQLKETWDKTASEWKNDIANWWNTKVAPWFTAKKWLDLYETVKTKLKETWDNTVGEWGTGITGWWNDDVSPWFTAQKWLDMYENIKISLGATWESTKNDWKKNLSDWWEQDVKPWFKLETWVDAMKGIPDAFKDAFDNAVRTAISILNDFIDKVNELFTFDWDFTNPMNGDEYSGSVTLFKIPHIPAFSSGGFPEDGLFMANSGELVGKFSNGRTAVANNEQIIDGIQRGVEYASIEQNALLKEQNELLRALLEKDTVIQMDSREVGRTMDKSYRRRGYTFQPT